MLKIDEGTRIETTRDNRAVKISAKKLLRNRDEVARGKGTRTQISLKQPPETK